LEEFEPHWQAAEVGSFMAQKQCRAKPKMQWDEEGAEILGWDVKVFVSRFGKRRALKAFKPSVPKSWRIVGFTAVPRVPLDAAARQTGANSRVQIPHHSPSFCMESLFSSALLDAQRQGDVQCALPAL
jgi:hypothetical protein